MPFVHHLSGQAIDHEWQSKVADFARWAKDRIDNMDTRVRFMARGVDVGAYDKTYTPKTTSVGPKLPAGTLAASLLHPQKICVWTTVRHYSQQISIYGNASMFFGLCYK